MKWKSSFIQIINEMYQWNYTWVYSLGSCSVLLLTWKANSCTIKIALGELSGTHILKYKNTLSTYKILLLTSVLNKSVNQRNNILSNLDSLLD